MILSVLSKSAMPFGEMIGMFVLAFSPGQLRAPPSALSAAVALGIFATAESHLRSRTTDFG
jgi:hypothetical protein